MGEEVQDALCPFLSLDTSDILVGLSSDVFPVFVFFFLNVV